jgi:hypothetical protein
MPNIVAGSIFTSERGAYAWGPPGATFFDPLQVQAGHLSATPDANMYRVCDSSGRADVVLSGFSTDAKVDLVRWAGADLVGGKWVSNHHAAVFHVHDPQNPGLDGYFLYSSIHDITTDTFGFFPS